MRALISLCSIGCSAAAPAPASRDAAVVVEDPCPSFRQTPIGFDTDSIRYAVEIAGDQVLIGLHVGLPLALRPGEAPRMLTSTSTSIADVGITFAVPRDDGSVALISTDCCVYDAVLSGDELSIDAPLCQPIADCEFVVDAVPHAGSRGLTWITGEGEVVDMSASGRFTLLGKLEDQRGAARVVRDSGGIVYAAQAGRHLAIADGLTFTLESPPILGVNLTALAFAEGVGVLLGDSAGHVYRRTHDELYEALGDPGFFTGVTRIIPLSSDRFWAIGGSGEGAIWHDGQFCPLEQVGAGLVLYAPRFGGGWLFIGRGIEELVGIWIR